MHRWVSAGVSAEWLSTDEVVRLVPVTAGGAFVGGAYSADDGIADVSALLDAYLRVAVRGGVRVLTGRRLVGVDLGGGAIRAVRTDRERIPTAALVNAAGAWAPQVAHLAGVLAPPLRSLKRHLILTAELPWIGRSWPFVWDVTHEVYFRPEPPGLLLSPCDAEEAEPAAADTTDPAALELLADKLVKWFPRLAGIAVAKVWAGLRTFTSDGNPLLGEDSAVRGLFWCAGLGGNGMTISAPVERMAAEAVVGHAPPRIYAAERFAA